jgi:hypothetical protein
MLLQLVLKVNLTTKKKSFINKKIFLGDYGRGGVEAIRRLLYRDACIGADFTMVNKFLYLILRYFFVVVVFIL